MFEAHTIFRRSPAEIDGVRNERRAITVLLVEDDPDLASGVAAYLRRRGIIVDFAHSVRAAKARVQESLFDLVIMDIQLPDGEGVRLCADLKASGLRSPVLFMTARGELDEKLRAFEAGALDYIVKPFAAAELYARVRALTEHVPVSGGLMIRAGAFSLDYKTGVFSGPSGYLTLSGPALTIMRKLIEAAPGNVTSDALKASIWGEEIPMSEPLRMHVYELRRALSAVFGKSLIQTVRGVGYRLGGFDEGS